MELLVGKAGAEQLWNCAYLFKKWGNLIVNFFAPFSTLKNKETPQDPIPRPLTTGMQADLK